MFRQRLLLIWANYRLHHLLRVAAEVSLGVFIVGGAVTTVVTVVPAYRKATAVKPVPVHVAVKPVTKPVPKKTAPPPAPAPQPAAAPAVTPPAPKPAAAALAPKPIAASQPSPGTGVKKLIPTPAPSAPAPAPATAPATSPSTSTGSSATSDPATTSTAPATTTSSGAPAAATGGYYSTNWAGYAAMTGKFTGVTGSWTVPKVTGNGSTTSGDAAWIGIGGVNTSDLIQTGTTDMVAADGTVTVAAFYELLPASAMELTGFTVAPGDGMTASIHELAAGQWSITITDTTSGQSYSTAVSYTSSYSSAEWIEEDPSYVDGSLVPFDNFGHVIFTAGSTIVGGSSASVAGASADPITLVDSASNPVATPSVLNSAGSGFWVTHD